MGFFSSINEARKDATSSAGKAVKKAGGSVYEMFKDAGTDVYEAQKDLVNFVWDDTVFAGQKSIDIFSDILSGDLGGAWDEVKATGGEHQRMMTDNLVDMGFSENNWITQNSDTVAAVIAAWYLAPEAAGAFEGEAAGASASEIAQAQAYADTIGSGMASGLDVASYGLGDMTAGQVGSYVGTGATVADSGWVDTAKKVGKTGKNLYSAFNALSGGGGEPTSQVGPTARNQNYMGMFDRLKDQIDPYQEITIPTGARY